MAQDDLQRLSPDANPADSTEKPNLTCKEVPTVDSCPRCDYSLRGLSAPHRCPECGLPYDEHSRAWHGNRLAEFRRRLWNGGLSLAVAVSLVLCLGPVGPAVVVVIFIAYALHDAFCLLWKPERLEPRVSIAPDGLRICNALFSKEGPTGASPAIPWSHVDRVSARSLSRSALVIVKGRRRKIRGVFADRSGVEEFVKGCRHYMALPLIAGAGVDRERT